MADSGMNGSTAGRPTDATPDDDAPAVDKPTVGTSVSVESGSERCAPTDTFGVAAATQRAPTAPAARTATFVAVSTAPPAADATELTEER